MSKLHPAHKLHVEDEWENVLWDRENSFAAACYDDNSIDELLDALVSGPDDTDMLNWSIGPEEWRMDVADALRRKIWELANK